MCVDPVEAVVEPIAGVTEELLEAVISSTMGGSGSSKKPAIVRPDKKYEKEAVKKIKTVKEEEQKKLREDVNRKATILTSGSGVEEEAILGKKTLLGV